MNRKQPKVTIITVTLNSEATVERTIKSVINQDYPHVEYIIIDGKSTDSTLDIVRNYSEYIDKIISEKDKGIYDAMNKGIKLATGELIGIINSDDWYAKGAISHIISCYLKNNEPDVLYGDMYKINHITGEKRLYEGSIEEVKVGDIHLNHPTIFIKKEIYDEYGSFDDSLIVGADRDLILRLRNNPVKFKNIHTIVAFFSMGGITSQNSLKFNWRRIRDKHRLLTRNNVLSIEKWSIILKDFLRLNRDWILKKISFD
jgi:glycosyltransferase involved in cell wall biosynthesis